MTQFAPIPSFPRGSVSRIPRSDEAIPIGSVLGRGSDDDLLCRGQNLLLALWSHPLGRAMAEEREIFIQGVEARGVRREVLAWQLACWRTPELRPFFDATGFRVQE
jgi:hypothetical protein